MNPLDYATLEASQRLVEKGIVLETEVWWIKVRNKWQLELVNFTFPDEHISALSLSEVWRELRKYIDDTDYFQLKSMVWDAMYRPRNNTIDDMLDLLIWVTGQRKE